MAATKTTPSEPKIVHKLALRTLFLVIVLGILYFGYQKWRDVSQDVKGFSSANTAGWLAAVQFQNDGQQVVAFDPNGKLVQSPGWATGKTDRDITWEPSGNRLFFVSDRTSNNYHIYRWNPTDGSEPDQRSTGTLAHGYPSFDRQDKTAAADMDALIISGGFVLDYAQKEMSTKQILPPQTREMSQTSDEEGGGSGSQFGASYGDLGNSFRVARWCKDKTWVAAVMRRDDGEVLIMQNMTPNSDGKYPSPLPLDAGDRIDFDVDPQDGSLVYTVQNFQWPSPKLIPDQFKKGNKITRPYHHAIVKFDPEAKSREVIAMSNDDNIAFQSPAISPDGSAITFVAGPFKGSAGLDPMELATCPLVSNGGASAAILVKGSVYEPNWSPDGNKIAFAQRQAGGNRSICVIGKDGSGLVNISGATGNFGSPMFSTQVGK